MGDVSETIEQTGSHGMIQSLCDFPMDLPQCLQTVEPYGHGAISAFETGGWCDLNCTTEL
jgi:hypothetical protein